MTIFYLLNENKEIIEDGFSRFNEKCLAIDQEQYHIKLGYNGRAFFEDYMQTEEYKEKERVFNQRVELKKLRKQREIECFSIINRGSFWYEQLTDEQKNELREWYHQWLDVTETNIVPEKPSWLQNY